MSKGFSIVFFQLNQYIYKLRKCYSKLFFLYIYIQGLKMPNTAVHIYINRKNLSFRSMHTTIELRKQTQLEIEIRKISVVL